MVNTYVTSVKSGVYLHLRYVQVPYPTLEAKVVNTYINLTESDVYLYLHDIIVFINSFYLLSNPIPTTRSHKKRIVIQASLTQTLIGYNP